MANAFSVSDSVEAIQDTSGGLSTAASSSLVLSLWLSMVCLWESVDPDTSFRTCVPISLVCHMCSAAMAKSLGNGLSGITGLPSM